MLPQDESHDAMFRPILIHYIESPSMLQKFLAVVVTEEWAREHDANADAEDVLLEKSPLAKDLSVKILSFLQSDPPAAYHEMMSILARIHNECYSLLHAFSHDCKLPVSMVPNLGQEIDITGTRAECFTISTARAAVGEMFDKLKDILGRTKKKELALIKEKRVHVAASIERYSEVKAQYDVRVCAAFAAAFVALKATPDKVSPIVKGIMNGIKVCLGILYQVNTSLTTHFRAKRMFNSKPVLLLLLPPSSTFAFSGAYHSLQKKL
jgi:TATA-binding protein-associated factor